jgi:uncharacterized protein (TIGR00369 family)
MTQRTEAPTGLELLQAISDGRLPGPGVATLIGMEIVSVEDGRVVFALDPGPEHGNPMGTTHGGILATLLDSAMTCAVQSKLPAGAWPTTLELSVRFLKPIPPGLGRVEATGTTVQVGSRVGTAEGRLTGPDGTLYAAAQTTCLVLADRS